LFDTSESASSHPLYSTTNKKILGKMKDETRGFPIQEFVGLKSKMYSLIYEEEHGVMTEKKTAKGIKKSVIKQHTRHEHYKQCLFEKEMRKSTMTQIRSYGHELYNINMNKLGLSPFDDKRFIPGRWHFQSRLWSLEDFPECTARQGINSLRTTGVIYDRDAEETTCIDAKSVTSNLAEVII